MENTRPVSKCLTVKQVFWLVTDFAAFPSYLTVAILRNRPPWGRIMTYSDGFALDFNEIPYSPRYYGAPDMYFLILKAILFFVKGIIWPCQRKVEMSAPKATVN